MMFSPDQRQWKTIWFTFGSVFVLWLFCQLAVHGSRGERFCNGVAVFVLAAGALRVWMLEGKKPKGSQ